MINLRKPLKIISITLFILSILASCVVILVNQVLPSHGIYIIFNTTGTSMGDTITDDALIIAREVPFEELEVGDIIFFREWANLHENSTTTVIDNRKGDVSGSSASGSSPSLSTDTSPSDEAEEENTAITGASRIRAIVHAVHDPTAIFYDRDIQYNPHTNVIHRIEVINTNGDRAVITKGDGNGGTDPRPVMASGYLYKVTWYKNGLGVPMRIIYSGFIYIIAATVVMSIALLITNIRMRSEEK